MTSAQNILWIIRSANERTQTNCIKLIKDFVPQDNIKVIQEKPFSKALEKSFELCYTSSFEWSIHIDADVLISKAGCEKLIEKTNTAAADVFAVQGVTIDKFIPIYRTAGNGIYRNATLKLASKFIGKDGEVMRPEAYLVDQMIAHGYNKLRTDTIVGIHDYEQYFKDIFRKMYVHTSKHRNIIAEARLYWERRKKNDKDFEIALLASKVASFNSTPISLHTSYKQEEREILFRLYDVEEKKELQKQLDDHDIFTAIEDAIINADMQKKKYPEYYLGNYILNKVEAIPTNPPKPILLQWGEALKHQGHRLIKTAKRL